MSKTSLPETVTIAEAAEILKTSESKVTRLLEEQALLAIKVEDEWQIPVSMVREGQVIPALRGTLILLTDIGLSNSEMLEWLLTENESLNQTPLEALQMGHKAPVRRAAQLLAEIY